jgi:CRISPR-associated protein Csd2
LYDIENGNPNGDPDMGNLPRIDHETGYGFVTDGCVKRKIRDWVDVLHGEEEHTQIYIQNRGIALNTLHRQAYAAENLTPVIDETDDDDTASATTGQGKQAKKVQKKKQPKEDIEQVCRRMRERFYDVRAFGAVMTTRINCGQVLGPLQLKFPISASPIEQCEISITRVAITAEGTDKSTEMGDKQFLHYALYRGHGFYSPFIAEKSGFSASDLALFWEALEWVWDFDRSASRGQQNFQGLYIFTHANPCGNAHAHKLFKRLAIQLRDSITVPRKFEDYILHLDEENLPEGITLTIIHPDEEIRKVKSREEEKQVK